MVITTTEFHQNILLKQENEIMTELFWCKDVKRGIWVQIICTDS